MRTHASAIIATRACMSPDRPHSLRCKKVSIFTLLNPEGCPELRNLSLILCEPAGGYFQPKNLNPADHAFGNLNGMRLDAFGGPGWSATCAVGGVSTVFPSLKEFDMRTLDDSRAPHFSVYNEMLKFSVFPKLETLNNNGCQSAIDIFHFRFGQCVGECRKTLRKLVIHRDL
ncbi:hypothetical protein BJ165DRAFT_428113 [Panaeolus papilionaceus]|nr:hypothetical protein BJ165DRAFT_428113 [Panaeolus papilionaceus]